MRVGRVRALHNKWIMNVGLNPTSSQAFTLNLVWIYSQFTHNLLNLISIYSVFTLNLLSINFQFILNLLSIYS